MFPILESTPGQTGPPRTNWSGNHTYHAWRLRTPQDPAGLREVIADAAELRALGSRHSFNAIADAEAGEQVNLAHLREIVLDAEQGLATVGAGITYTELAQAITPAGYAVANLASLPHISVAGAVQTGTHGSGLVLGGLATSVLGLEMTDAAGHTQWFRRATHGESFDGMVVALGCLGIVSRMEVAVVPSFEVRQMVYEELPFSVLTANLRAVMSAGYSVSLFTHWHDRTIAQAWVKQQTAPGDAPMPAALFGAEAAAQERHPLPGHEAGNCTPQRGVPGPWYERLPHFRSGFQPSSGQELQTEYFVSFEQGAAALEAVAAISDEFAPLLFVSELRAIAADSLWLSPCYQRESLTLHFTWRPDWPAVQRVLPKIEAALSPFAPRPHWGKLFTMAPGIVRAQYAQLNNFQALAGSMDPRGKFRNEFTRRYLFG